MTLPISLHELLSIWQTGIFSYLCYAWTRIADKDQPTLCSHIENFKANSASVACLKLRATRVAYIKSDADEISRQAGQAG